MAYNIPAMKVSPAPMVLQLVSYLFSVRLERDSLDYFAALLLVGRDSCKPSVLFVHSSAVSTPGTAKQSSGKMTIRHSSFSFGKAGTNFGNRAACFSKHSPNDVYPLL